MKTQVWDFMNAIPLPSHFLTSKHLAMMVLLLFPTITKKSETDRRYLPELHEHFQTIRVACYEVFKENNIRKRRAFFSEPLIQFLWGELFAKIRPDITINHLRRMRSHPIDGEYRYQMIVNDMLQLESCYNLVIIPAEARCNDVIKEFTPEEAEADLAENQKFNIRSSQMLKAE